LDRSQHRSQLREHSDVEDALAWFDATVGEAWRERQRSTLACIADVDMADAGQSPLVEDCQPLADQWMERVGYDERAR